MVLLEVLGSIMCILWHCHSTFCKRMVLIVYFKEYHGTTLTPKSNYHSNYLKQNLTVVLYFDITPTN